MGKDGWKVKIGRNMCFLRKGTCFPIIWKTIFQSLLFEQKKLVKPLF